MKETVVRRGLHLAAGAFLLLGYYAGLPAHLWEETAGFRVPPEGVAVASPAWRVSKRRASDAPGEPRLEACGNRLQALWLDGETPVFVRSVRRWRPRVVAQELEGRFDQAVLAGHCEGRPALLLRRQDGQGSSWLHYHAGEQTSLRLAPLPGASWHAGSSLRYREGGVAVALRREEDGRLVLLRLDRQARVLGLHPAGRASRPVPVRALADGRFAGVLWSGFTAPGWTSADGGRSWHAGQARLPELNGAPFSVVRRGEGWWWLLSVHERAGREEIRVHETRDYARDWQRRTELDWITGGRGDCAAVAPAAAQTRDGTVHLLHRSGECRLLHARLTAGGDQ